MNDKSTTKTILEKWMYGFGFESHPTLGKGIIKKGKTKKFKIYQKGFTYKSLFKEETKVWEDVKDISIRWSSEQTNFSGTSSLRICIYLKNSEKPLIVKFSSPIFIINTDLTNKSETMIKVLYYFSEKYSFGCRCNESFEDMSKRIIEELKEKNN